MNHKKWLSPVLSIVIAAGCVCSVQAAEAAPVATLTYGDHSQTFTSFSDGWNASVSAAKTNKDAVLTLNSDWHADKNGSLGKGDGFKNGALLCNTKNSFTLDLNGNTVDRGLIAPTDDGAVIYVESDFIVTDSAKTGVITGGANTGDGGGIVVKNGASFTLNGGTVLNCVSEESGGGIFSDGEKNKVTVDGGSLQSNRAYSGSGGAIRCNDGNVILKNALLESNFADEIGGAVYMDDGNIKAYDSRFYGNRAVEKGGAVYVDGGTDSNIENCLFTHNTSEDGGACYIDSNDGTYLKNCRMLNNKASSEGGAVFSVSDKVFLVGGTYQKNTAGENGGGIYIDSMYDVNIAGKLIVSDNTVNKKDNDLCLQNGNFSTAYLYCGGLYDGSLVYLCSTDGDARLAVSDIDTYQYKNYIRFNSGFAQDRVESHNQSQAGISAEGSALGSGNVMMVALFSALVLVIAVIMIIIAIKRKKGAVGNDN